MAKDIVSYFLEKGEPLLPKPKPRYTESLKVLETPAAKKMFYPESLQYMKDTLQQKAYQNKEITTSDYYEMIKPQSMEPKLVDGRIEFKDGGDYWSMVTRMFVEAGSEKGTGMNINDFAAMYFPRDQKSDGGRIGFADGPPKTSPIKTDVYKYPVGNKFGTRYAMQPRGNQYTKKSGVSLQTDEFKNKIAKEIKDNFLRYNDVKKEYGKKTADIFKGQYPNVGKISSDKGKKEAVIKRDNWIKANSSVSMLQKISGDKGRGNLQLSHLYSKNVPDSLKTLGYLPSDVNIKSYSKFEKPLTTAIDKVYSELDKKKTNAKALLAAFKQYQTEDRKLRAQFPEYKDTKSRLSFKRTGFDPSGIMIQEKLINPKLAISKEAGTQLKGVMPSSSKGQGIISLANLAKEKLKNLVKVKGVGGGTQELYKDPLGGPDLIRVRDIIRND